MSVKVKCLTQTAFDVTRIIVSLAGFYKILKNNNDK